VEFSSFEAFALLESGGQFHTGEPFAIGRARLDEGEPFFIRHRSFVQRGVLERGEDGIVLHDWGDGLADNVGIVAPAGQDRHRADDAPGKPVATDLPNGSGVCASSRSVGAPPPSLPLAGSEMAPSPRRGSR